MLRRPLTGCLLQAAVSPVAGLYASFMSLRSDILYRLNHNGQVCHMTAMLNDSFDCTARRIRITDAEGGEWGYFLWKEEFDRPVMLGVFMLQAERFIGADSIDFIVLVPYALNLTDDGFSRMHSLIRYYKLAGKRYAIQRE